MTHRLVVGQLALCAALLLAGCTQKMAQQTRCEPYERSAAFADGRCDRPLPPNTVPRSTVRGFFAGVGGANTGGTSTGGESDQRTVANGGLPFALTRQVLEVGQDRYATFCAPCHGLAGYGDGMIVQRGFRPPPSFHSERLRQVPPEYIVQVITDGFGVMYSYADRVPEDERWAVAAYVKTLQLSQDAPAELAGQGAPAGAQGARP